MIIPSQLAVSQPAAQWSICTRDMHLCHSCVLSEYYSLTSIYALIRGALQSAPQSIAICTHVTHMRPLSAMYALIHGPLQSAPRSMAQAGSFMELVIVYLTLHHHLSRPQA